MILSRFLQLINLIRGIGRLVGLDMNLSTQLVNKIEHYMNNGLIYTMALLFAVMGNQGNKTFGDWRLKVVQILADDEDNNYFIVNDTEPHY